MDISHSATARPHTVRTRFTAIASLIAIALTTVLTLGGAHADAPPNVTNSGRLLTDASTYSGVPTPLPPATGIADGAPLRIRVTNNTTDDLHLAAN